MPLVLEQPGLQPADLVVNELGVLMDVPVDDGWLLEASADGTTWGNPEAVISSIQSQLQDGSLESHDRDDNREASILMKISAPGSPAPGRAIALGQKALELACRWPAGQVREMRWTAPLVGAQTTVFEMTSATVQRQFDNGWDLGQEMNAYRLFKLTIHARPFVRGMTPATIEALEVTGSSTTPVDDGTSTTGWSLLEASAAATTNLETNPTPSGLNGWTAGPGASSMSFGIGGLTVGSTAGSGTRVYATSVAYPVVAGRSYAFGSTLNIDMYAGGGARATGTLVRWYSNTAATAQIGSDAIYTGPTLSPSATGDVKTPVLTAPAGALRARYYPFVVTGGGNSSGGLYYIKRRWANECVTAAEIIAGYLDGGVADTAALNYAWNGGANASTSTASWTTASLLPISGTVRGTIYGRSVAPIRRAGAIDMSTLNYIRIKGAASVVGDPPPGVQVTVADNGGTALTPVSYSYNATSGNYEIVVKRPEGFTTVDVTATRINGAISTTGGLFIAVDSIAITNAPFGTGAVQVRQVEVYGSQRTEISIDVRGLDAAGTAPVGLGEQVAVCTAAAGDDGRAKVLAVRAASTVNNTPTTDATATSGVYNPLATIASAAYPTFSLDSAALLPGTYDVYGSIWTTLTGSQTVSLRADLDAGLDAVRVGDWQDTAITTGSAWPQIPEDTYRLVPLGTVTIGEDGGTLTLSVASAAGASTRVDDLFLFHRQACQLSLLDTKTATGSFSEVRLDAATVTRPRPAAWVGVVDGKMMDAALAGRCQAFAQHQGDAGLVQIFTITPGCPSSRVSATYFEKFGHDVASVLV